MGQIIGSAAKPKRCNLQSLSSFGTPAAGEYILVSSDNSMNAAGQGNFDCYIEGDGQTAATALPLREIVDGFSAVKDALNATWTTLSYVFTATAKYTSVDVAYNLKKDHIYRVIVETPCDYMTYFAVRKDGANLQNALMKGIGERDLSFICNGDAPTLRMTYGDVGTATTHTIRIIDVTNAILLNMEEQLDNMTTDTKETTYVLYADGTRWRFGRTLPIGTTIRSLTGGPASIILYKNDADATGETFNANTLPRVTTKEYTGFTTYKSGSPKTTIVFEYTGILAQHASSIENIEGDIHKVIIPTEADFTAGKGFSAGGVLISQVASAYATEEYYYFPKGSTINFDASLQTGYPILVIYDSKKTFVQKYDGVGAANVRTWSHTFAEDGYARFGCYNGKFDNFSVESDAIAVDVAENRGVTERSWVASERERIEELIKEQANDDIVVFAFHTDQHANSSVNSVNQPIIRGLEALRKITDKIPFDLVVLGGDEAGYNGNTDNTIDGIIKDIEIIRNPIDTWKCPVVAIAGNHDAFQNAGAAISNGNLEYNYKTRSNVTRLNVSAAGSASTNSYMDDEAKKIRYVFLDGYSVKNGQTLASYGASGNTELVSMIDEAFGDAKLKNSEWKVVLFSHNVIPANVSGNSFGPMGDAFWARIKTYLDGGVSLAFAMNGHGHCITQGVKDGYALVACDKALPVMAVGSGIEQSFDGNTYVNKLNTPTETSYDVFVWNRTTSKLYAFHYGAGCDRIINLTTGAIELDHLTGTATYSGGVDGKVLTAKSHNCEYTYTLGTDGAFDFPYLCPDRTWTFTINIDGTSGIEYNSSQGSHSITLDF